MVLSRDIASLGIYPAVDPLDSTSRQLDPNVVGEDHYATARAVQGTLQRYQGTARHHRYSGHGRTGPEDKLAVARARKIQRFRRNRSMWPKCSLARRANTCLCRKPSVVSR